MQLAASFRDDVYGLMAQVPYGQVTTYGDIAALAGHPYAARVVGQIAHFGPETVPWHRLVNKSGLMARGYWGGPEAHQAMLEAEGVEIVNYKIIGMDRYRWQPL
jgi:methylated-DNA-protein-cysteine methyltransferase-like protein